VRFFKRIFVLAIVCAVLGAAGYFVAYPMVTAYVMPDDIRMTRTEIENRTSVSPHNLINAEYEKAIFTDDQKRTFIDLKLFGFIPLKRVMVDVLPYDELCAGGLPVGFMAKTDGAVVLRDAGKYRRGDVITEIEGATITGVDDLKRHLGERKLGVWVKDDTSGVGTLTYVNPQNNNFAALGHKLVDFETGANVNLRSGDVYACNVVGIEKSNARTVGTLQSTLRRGSEGVQGSVLSSNNRGVFGCLNEQSILAKKCANCVYPVASRYSVKTGRATILCSLDGEKVEEFEIKIEHAKYQPSNADKGLVLRVTDERLLNATGGIVHGMSGSPIIQNGHLVGAVTHVMQKDVTRGYGVYVDFLLP
jgi:stage IV sporulation protein B